MVDSLGIDAKPAPILIELARFSHIGTNADAQLEALFAKWRVAGVPSIEVPKDKSFFKAWSYFCLNEAACQVPITATGSDY
uniref:Uncharacterized protein n=1 Tax=Hyaloperonospora arabidopsidis (strain Emoy2) TaxID=559515 RepID=M4BRR4_HYAAE